MTFKCIAVFIFISLDELDKNVLTSPSDLDCFLTSVTNLTYIINLPSALFLRIGKSFPVRNAKYEVLNLLLRKRYVTCFGKRASHFGKLFALEFCTATNTEV